jgi:hypothetical protein
MISMELSTVQHNTAKSAELNAAVSDYLAQGGVICTLQGFAYQPKPAPESKPKPYGRLALGDRPKPAPKLRAARKPREPSPEAEARRRARAEKYELVRQLAATMTITQVLYRVGLSNHRLKALAAQGGFEFQTYDPTPTLKPNKVNRDADPANVSRILEARDRGLSRKAAKDELGISNTLMKRLITEYSIDYPLQRSVK